ncbi:hypothetical protein [Streptomyces sp. NBC_00045]|uniref:hypothetical protein n=1 Tax=Streptomyces sp. NBC_00045 TaxID=2975625 RepID=UPI003248B810
MNQKLHQGITVATACCAMTGVFGMATSQASTRSEAAATTPVENDRSIGPITDTSATCLKAATGAIVSGILPQGSIAVTVMRSGALYTTKAVLDVNDGKTVGRAVKENLPLSVLTAITAAAKVSSVGTKAGPVAAGVALVVTSAIVKAACFPAPPYRHKGTGLINLHPRNTERQTNPNTQRYANPDTSRLTNPNTQRHTNPDTNRLTDSDTNQHTNPDTNRQTDPNTNQHTNPDTNQQTDPGTAKMPDAPTE